MIGRWLLAAVLLLPLAGCDKLPFGDKKKTSSSDDDADSSRNKKKRRRNRASGDAGSGRAPSSACRRTDWWCLLGFRYGDSKAKVLAKLGLPASTDSSVEDFEQLRFVDEYGPVSVMIHSEIDKIYVISVRKDGVEWLRGYGIDDPRLNIIGMKRDQVFALYGKPDRSSSDSHTWDHVEGDKRGDFVTSCYDFNDFVCEDLAIYWYFH